MYFSTNKAINYRPNWMRQAENPLAHHKHHNRNEWKTINQRLVFYALTSWNLKTEIVQSLRGFFVLSAVFALWSRTNWRIAVKFCRKTAHLHKQTDEHTQSKIDGSIEQYEWNHPRKHPTRRYDNYRLGRKKAAEIWKLLHHHRTLDPKGLSLGL